MKCSRYSLLLWFLCSLCSLSSLQAAEQLIIEPEMGRAPILSALNRAQHEIDLVMYGFTDPILLQQLFKQKERGIIVKILLEETPYQYTNENQKTIAFLNDHHIDWKTPTLLSHASRFHLVHQKTLIIDHKEAMVMTFNFTRSAFKHTRNFALLIDDPTLVHEIHAVFLADWEQLPTPSHHLLLLYSPEDSRHKLMQAIQSAQQTIDLYTQSLSDTKIIYALIAAAKRGVNITLLTSLPVQSKKMRLMKNAGISLKRSHHFYIHAKVWIIDHKQAIIGSVNLTRSSLDTNRELSVVTTHPAILEALEEKFHQDIPLAIRNAKINKASKMRAMKANADEYCQNVYCS